MDPSFTPNIEYCLKVSDSRRNCSVTIIRKMPVATLFIRYSNVTMAPWYVQRSEFDNVR